MAVKSIVLSDHARERLVERVKPEYDRLRRDGDALALACSFDEWVIGGLRCAAREGPKKIPGRRGDGLVFAGFDWMVELGRGNGWWVVTTVVRSKDMKRPRVWFGDERSEAHRTGRSRGY